MWERAGASVRSGWHECRAKSVASLVRQGEGKQGGGPSARQGAQSRWLILPLAFAQTDQVAHDVKLSLLKSVGHASQVASVVTKLKCRLVDHLEMLHGAWSDKPAPARSPAQGP